MSIDSQTYLIVDIAATTVAFEAEKVVEVQLEARINPIPRPLSYIKGVVNYRGTIITVVDLNLKCDLEPTDSPDNIIAIVKVEQNNTDAQIGILIDKVHKVETVKKAAINTAPEFGAKYATEHIKGVFRYKEHFVPILRLAKIFEAQ